MCILKRVVASKVGGRWFVRPSEVEMLFERGMNGAISKRA